MKYLLLLLLLSVAFSAQAQIKMETGLILNGGKGNMEGKLNPIISEDGELKFDVYDNKAHFSIGYRFRIKPVKSPLFYDIDLNVGARLWEYRYYAPPANSEPHPGFINSTSSVYAYGSLAGSVNYSIYKGLSLGLGIEPVYYFYKSGEETDKPAFGIPLVGKIAYNFRFMEIGFSYKYGLANTIKSKAIKSGRFNDWQFSLFIPF